MPLQLKRHGVSIKLFGKTKRQNKKLFKFYPSVLLRVFFTILSLFFQQVANLNNSYIYFDNQHIYCFLKKFMN
jgi:hypothetical protein